MPKSKSKSVGKWMVTVSHGLHVKRSDGMTLLVGLTSLGDGDWQVLALETKTKNATDTQAVLDRHAHKFIGNFALDVAFKKSRAYADAWVKKKGCAEVCECAEIDPVIDEAAMRAAVDLKYPKKKRPYTKRHARVGDVARA